MCGIAGSIGKNSAEEVKGLVGALHHRGPDDDGFYTADNFAMGMRRLSIIDLSGGHQPIESFDGRYSIVFNGEIYNYKELKEELVGQGHKFKTNSDTEVILRMFEVYGKESFSRLRGMFVFSIYDKQEGRVVLVRDFFGIKPLYYYATRESSNSSDVEPAPKTSPAHGQRGEFATDISGAGLVAFSSEIKSFLTLPDFTPEVNDSAVFNYLSYQYNPLPETFFKNVYKLAPGHLMEVDTKTGKYKVEKYWQFSFDQSANLREEEARERVRETMQDSVAHHMIADVPVGSFLSGGIDSSIIATLAKQTREDGKLKTFTVGWEGLSEGAEAKETSDPLGTEHTEIAIDAKEYFDSLPKVLWHFDEPVADPSALGIYFLAREARKHVKVVLSGEGADELFGGYNIYLEPYARRWISWVPKFVLKGFISLPFSYFGKNYIKRAHAGLEGRYIGNAIVFDNAEVNKIWQGGGVERYTNEHLYKEIKSVSEPTKMQYVDINTWLVGDILAKADKMTMAHSLELRVPFLDKEVADLARTLPDKFKWRGGVTKYLLREAFTGLLPESTRKRRKLGFPTPIRNWFTKERKEMLQQIVTNDYIKTHLDTQEVERIWEEHVSGKKDNARKIYLLLALAVWYDVFIKKSTRV